MRVSAHGMLEAVEQAILENPQRVLLLDLPDRERTYLLYLYGKDESEDITAEQKKQIVALVTALKRER